MPLIETLIGPVASLINQCLADPPAREPARRTLPPPPATCEAEALCPQLSAMVAEAQSADRWTSRARPSFLYVMYIMILWSIPMGLMSAVQPRVAHNVTAGMTAYLGAIPDSIWALFGAGYLGYTAARSWGKARGSER